MMNEPAPDAARSEISNVLCLYANSLDRRQWTLMEHVFHEDAFCGIGVEPIPWRPWRDNAARIFDASLDRTHHQLGLPLIVVEGASAWVETYCTAHHRVRADAPVGGKFAGTGEPYDMISGLRYADHFQFRNGGWKIARRQGIADWRHQRVASDGTFSLVDPEFKGAYGTAAATSEVVKHWANSATTAAVAGNLFKETSQ